MANHSLSDYVQELTTKKAAWLGQIVFFSVPEATIVKERSLKKILNQAQLDQFLPALPRPSNVFRRVSSAHNMKRVPTDDPNVFEDYRTEEVIRQDRRIVKDIVVRQTNLRDEELRHQPQVRLEFNNVTGELSHYWLKTAGRRKNPQSLAVAELIADDFAAVVDSYNCTMLRGMFRHVLSSSRSTLIQKKAYFVSSNYAEYVAGLQFVGDSIPGVEVAAIPLVDTQQQREMIRQAYISETLDEIDRTLVELDKFKGQDISSDQYASILVAKDELKSRTREYQDLLGVALDEADIRIKVYEKRVGTLLKYVK